MENYQYTGYRGNKTYTKRYSKKEIENFWKTLGQGHDQALKRDLRYCIVLHCSHEEALIYTAIFIRHFHIPTCTHYNGATLSLYCLDAGSDFQRLKDRVWAAINYHVNYGVDEHGQLFADA